MSHCAPVKTYKKLELEARALCPRAFVKQLGIIRPQRVVIATIVLWVQLLSAWLAALWGPPLFWIPAFLVICACISAMQLWVHESSHFSLFRRRSLNDLWATLFFASPIGVSVGTYRQFHITHHARLSETTDMDRFAFNVDLVGLEKLLCLLMRGLSCVEGSRIVARKYFGPKRVYPGCDRDWSLLASAGWNTSL